MGRSVGIWTLVVVVVMARDVCADEVAHHEAKEERSEPAGGYVTVVRAKRTNKGLSVRTIDRAAVEASGADNTAELLEGESSIHANSGSRGERIFSLRGFSQRQLSVLIDGAPAVVPYDGQLDLGMLPAALVERVTVVKGPGSVLYGPNGMGGAVNIVSRRPGKGPLAELTGQSGRSGFWRLTALHALEVNERLAYTVHGGFAQRDAFALSSRFARQKGENGVLRQNSDRRGYHLGARVWAAPAAGHELEAGLTFVDGARGVPGSAVETTRKYRRFTTWRALSATLSHAGRYLGRLRIDEQLYVSLFDNLLDGYDDATFSTQTSGMASHAWYRDRIVGGRVRLRHQLPQTPWGPTALRLWAGVQHERHRRDDEDGTPPLSSHRTLITVAPEAETTLLELLRLTVAFQTDIELPEGQSNTAVGLGPLLSIRLPLKHGLRLQATVARRNRFPTLKERHSSNNGLRQPNPDLRPEAAWNVGLDVSWRARRWLTVQAAFFDAEVTDLIERIYFGEGRDKLVNIGSARLLGGELWAKLAPLRWLKLTAGSTALHARRTDAAEQSWLPYRPAIKATFALAVEPWPWLSLSSNLLIVGPQYFEHPETKARGTLGSYARLNAKLVVTPCPWASFRLSGKNILDANYQTKFGYPDPGWQVFVGLRLRYPR